MTDNGRHRVWWFTRRRREQMAAAAYVTATQSFHANGAGGWSSASDVDRTERARRKEGVR